MAAYRCLVGPSQQDIVAYVRARTEDPQSATSLIPDANYRIYVARAALQFSQWLPLGNFAVGNVSGSTGQLSSPLSTVKDQQRYRCISANGFTLTPIAIKDVLYRVSTLYNAAADIGMIGLVPFSPWGRFLTDPTSPSSRILRNDLFRELDHYGKGFYTTQLDTDGVWSIDLYPVPEISGLPILVRYVAGHSITALNGDTDTLATIPDDRAYDFGDWLLASVREEEAEALARGGEAQAGQIRETQNAEVMYRMAQDLKAEVRQRLGEALPSVLTSF